MVTATTVLLGPKIQAAYERRIIKYSHQCWRLFILATEPALLLYF
jgi:hypothetical protein